ncbi:MAG: hypothetical protein KDA61_19025, partial [Planctomycetales bacterium]|nr:hypothetical protein [Planctomycetales bacterium]
QAFGLQGFYVTQSSYTLDVTLSGIAYDAPEPSSTVFNEDGSVVAHVMLLRDNDPSSDISYTSHYATMKFELIPGSDVEILSESLDGSGAAALVIPPDNVVHSVSATLNVAGLTPGELIYVWADLNASGTRGGFGDAYSTLTMSFQDPTGLSHTPIPNVPEPTSGLLWLIGLAGSEIGARRRRR